MDIENLVAEYNKMVEQLRELDPGTEKHEQVLRTIEREARMIREYYELEDSRLDKNRTYDLEEQKCETERAGIEQRAKDARDDRITRIVSTLLSIGGGVLGILLSGDLSDYTVIDRNKFSFVKDLFRAR